MHFLGFPGFFQANLSPWPTEGDWPWHCSRSCCWLSIVVQSGNCILKDQDKKETEFPFHFSYQAEGNFQYVAQKVLPRDTSKTGKTRQNNVWKSCWCVREHCPKTLSFCKYLVQPSTVQVRMQGKPAQEICCSELKGLQRRDKQLQFPRWLDF